MTRRDFTKLSISSFLLGGGMNMSHATPRRSLLAAKRIANLPRKAWRNPYVTDGLIAMWDGEWNVAGGVHDTNSRTWRDLIGGRTLSLNGSAAFGSNYMETKDKHSGAISDFSLNASYFETVIYADDNSGGQGWASLFDDLNGTWVWFDSMNVIGIGTCYWNGEFYAAKYNTIQFAMSYNPPRAFVNGIELDLESGYADEGSGVFSIFGNYNYTGEACCQGKCYTTRFYSRIPTDSERAANYAIDKQRFDLP